MPASACATALLRLIDESTIAGEVVTVHPAAGPSGQIEPLDPSGQYAHLGAWRADSSAEVAAMVDGGFAGVKDGSFNAWSGI